LCLSGGSNKVTGWTKKGQKGLKLAIFGTFTRKNRQKF
jgi:hypothetical protein